MSLPDEVQIYREANGKFGARAQFEQATEELAELQLALRHYARGKASRDDVLDELVDVGIMIGQLRETLAIQDTDYAAAKASKLARLARLLGYT